MAVDSLPVTTRPGPALPTWARAAILLTAWVPFTWLVLVSVPRFDPVFARLEGKVGLPDLTRACLWFGRLNAGSFGLPVLGGIAVVLGLDWLAGRRAGRARGYWIWFVAAAGLGAVATLAVVAGLVLPVFRMGEPVG